MVMVQRIQIECKTDYNHLHEEIISHFVHPSKYTTGTHVILRCRQREDETI